MATPAARRSMENMEYVRRLLSQRQPGFSAALERAIELAELELWPPQMPAGSAVARLMTS